MFGIGLSEFLVILCVIIVLVRPKDLPKVFRLLGKIVGQLKRAYAEIVATKDKLVKDIDEAVAAEKDAEDKTPEEKR
jgi:sec-independent protein translocase protein TatB